MTSGSKIVRFPSPCNASSQCFTVNGACIRSHLLYASSCLSIVPGSDHGPGSHNLQPGFYASLGSGITGEHWSGWQTDAAVAPWPNQRQTARLGINNMGTGKAVAQLNKIKVCGISCIFLRRWVLKRNI